MKVHAVRGGGGLRLHVREWRKADGPPILFIHGWSQNHLCWQKQYESALTDEFRLVAYDLHGHGMSVGPLDKPQGRGSVRGRVRDQPRSLREVDVPPLNARRRRVCPAPWAH